MSNAFPRRYSLASLKKEAKRWLGELQAGHTEARARLERALPKAAATPTLRDVQHALALDDARYLVAIEHGFSNWDSLRAFTESSLASDRVPAKPVRLINPDAPAGSHPIASSRDWGEAIQLLRTHPTACLQAQGQMT